METDKIPQETSIAQSNLENEPVHKSLLNQKGSFLLILGTVVILIVLGAGAYFILGKNQIVPQQPTTQQKTVNQNDPNLNKNRPPLASITDSEKEEIYNILTSNTWCDKKAQNSESMLAPTQKNYTFRKDGTYNYSHFSDYPEDSGTGKWNFKAVTKNGGVIFLETGDVLNFELNNNSLSLADLNLDKCDLIKYDQTNYSLNC